MGILIAIGIVAGGFLDDYFKMEQPLFTAALSIIGLAAAFYLVFKDLSNDAN